MDLNNLPEPWDIQIFNPGQHIWRKPRRCKNIYIHMRAAGGNGGAGQSGTAGTKRGGGGGGSGGSASNYYGPSIAFDEGITFTVPAEGTVADVFGKFFSTPSTSSLPDFYAIKGTSGSAGSAGIGGAGGVFINTGSPFTRPGIAFRNVILITGRDISPGSEGGYPGGNTNPKGNQTLGFNVGAGGGGITDTFVSNSTTGGNLVAGGGEGNGILAAGTFYVVSSNINLEGGDGGNGTTIWYKNKPLYLSVAGSGGNASANGTGGKGGSAGIGCGGGGGGAGVTGGAGGTGGPGVAIVVSW